MCVCVCVCVCVCIYIYMLNVGVLWADKSMTGKNVFIFWNNICSCGPETGQSDFLNIKMWGGHTLKPCEPRVNVSITRVYPIIPAFCNAFQRQLPFGFVFFFFFFFFGRNIMLRWSSVSLTCLALALSLCLSRNLRIIALLVLTFWPARYLTSFPLVYWEVSPFPYLSRKQRDILFLFLVSST